MTPQQIKYMFAAAIIVTGMVVRAWKRREGNAIVGFGLGYFLSVMVVEIFND